MDASLRLGVECTAGFVQNEQTRRLEQCTGEGDSGTLTATQHGTTVTDHGVDAVLKFLDKVPSSGHLEGVFELGIGCFLVVDDVVSYGAVEQEGVLAHETNGLTKRMKGVVRDGAAVDQDLSAVGSVIAHEQLQDGGFACTGVAHHAKEFTFADLEGNAVEDFDGGVWIGEVHIVEFNRLHPTLKCNGVLAVNDGGFEVNRRKHAPGRCLAALKLVDENAEDEHRHGHSGADKQEGNELPRGDFALAGKVASSGDQEAEGDAGNGVNHRNEAVAVFACTHGLVSIGPRFCTDTVRFPLFGVVGLDDGNAGNEVLENGVNIAR